MWWKISLCCFGFFFLLDLSCTSNEKPALDGEQLAKLYCVGCHLYPEPDVLDQKSWEEYLLPRMGYMLGIYPNDSIRADLLGQAAEASLIEKRQIYPKGPRLDAAEWEAIKRFYLKQAPASLPIPKTTKIHPELPNFQTRMPNFRLSPPSTTFIKLNKDGTLLLGDAHTKAFYQIGNDLTIQQAANSGEGVVHVEQRADAYRLTVMGTFSPNDLAKGMIFELPLSKQEAPRILIKGLQRPVHHSSADLNADGLEDIVICEFAKWTGGLSWWEQQRNGQYSKHLLRERPGATKAYVRDFNGDDKPDVIALFGQGDEGIFLYLNQGDGQFIEKVLLRFPASYGSSYFNLFDYNGDEFPDLIYTNGDNADFPPILKPYHGIRIFQNDGQNNFEEVFFYPLNGAYKAIPADFDQDGDMDIAAISFFPDFSNRKEEGFVFLDNQGALEFKTYSFPTVNKGRWIVMDAEDADGDGDLDIALGSLAFEAPGHNALVNQWASEGIPFLILENTINE